MLLVSLWGLFFPSWAQRERPFEGPGRFSSDQRALDDIDFDERRSGEEEEELVRLSRSQCVCMIATFVYGLGIYMSSYGGRQLVVITRCRLDFVAKAYGYVHTTIRAKNLTQKKYNELRRGGGERRGVAGREGEGVEAGEEKWVPTVCIPILTTAFESKPVS